MIPVMLTTSLYKGKPVRAGGLEVGSSLVARLRHANVTVKLLVLTPARSKQLLWPMAGSTTAGPPITPLLPNDDPTPPKSVPAVIVWVVGVPKVGLFPEPPPVELEESTWTVINWFVETTVDDALVPAPVIVMVSFGAGLEGARKL